MEEVFPGEVPVVNFYSPSGIGEGLYTTVRGLGSVVCAGFSSLVFHT